MSRSGYSDDGCEDQWQQIRWNGAVKSAIRGARGQAFLRELLDALDAMPEKVLVTDELQVDGQFCTLGVIGKARGLPIDKIDTHDWSALSREFGIAETMAREIMYFNDEGVNDYDWVDVEICGPMRPWQRHRTTVRVDAQHVGERRWRYMRKWVASQIKELA